MSRDAITEREPLPQGGSPSGIPRQGQGQEVAPSILRDDDLATPRVLGMIGLMLLIFGGTALFFNLGGMALFFNTPPTPTSGYVSLSWSIFLVAIGLIFLLIHAGFDRDLQVRMLFFAFSVVLMVAGVGYFLAVLRDGWYALGGMISLALAVPFLLSFLKNTQPPFPVDSPEPALRQASEFALLVGGAFMAVIGVAAAVVKPDTLLVWSLPLALLGLLYLSSFVVVRGTQDDLGYSTGLALAAGGACAIALVLIRTLSSSATYFVPEGAILTLVGLAYIFVGLGITLDTPFVVLTRREVTSFFYSMSWYLCLLGFGLFAWLSYFLFVVTLTNGPFEPIVQHYIFSLFPVVAITFMVPVLTMKTYSEENRSGTLEVLLTSPVSEVTVVMSKFVGGLLTYLIVWLPLLLLLFAIPLNGGTPFDYRPLLSFLIALIVTGAAFISMGQFFSSLTDNSIASGALTFVGMMAMLAVWMVRFLSGPLGISENLGPVLSHCSYLNLWQETLMGKVIPHSFLFFLAQTVFFLFLTVKVLEFRKWR
jgi:ABC-2 type transport system permease protein